jgi:hypothetical protein
MDLTAAFETKISGQMIAKMSSSNALCGALAYNRNKVNSDHAKVIFASRMIEPVDGKTGTAHINKPRPEGFFI